MLNLPNEFYACSSPSVLIYGTLMVLCERAQNALEDLFGPTLHLNASTLELSFPTAFQRLHISFYRSKLTSWMAAQEEDYR